jgi:thioredoxin-related protein
MRLLALTGMAVAITALMIQASGDDGKVATSGKAEVKWYGYEDGWKKAKTEKKHMFVDFTATWCTWCKKLDANTFSDPNVVKALNDDFVPVKVWDHDPDTLDIDGFKITVKDLIKKEFRVNGFPSLWFVSPEGARIGPAGGYVDPQRFMTFLEIVKYYRYDSTRNEKGEKIITEEKTEKK